MKIGTTIQNNDMTLTLAAYYGNEIKNVVLLVSENGCGGCHYVTACDLTREKNGNYFWYYDYYTDDFDKAVTNLKERRENYGL